MRREPPYWSVSMLACLVSSPFAERALSERLSFLIVYLSMQLETYLMTSSSMLTLSRPLSPFSSSSNFLASFLHRSLILPSIKLPSICSRRYEYKTHAKDRWYRRELVEIFTTEFRDRTKEYYVSLEISNKSGASSHLSHSCTLSDDRLCLVFFDLRAGLSILESVT